MRKRISVIAIAVALAALLTSTATTQGTDVHPSLKERLGCYEITTVQDFRGFAEKVWDKKRWRREGGQPKQATLDAMREKVRCARSASHRKAQKRVWRKLKAAYYDYRQRKRERARYLNAINPPGASVLAAIRSCESGGNYQIIDSSGTYFGAYQFNLAAWQEVGGSGLPSDAPPKEQDERAAVLYRIHGSSPWPVCGV
jgi:hypothetical protein